LLNALLWVLVYWRVGISPMLPVDLIFVSAMVALIFIDAEHMILPNVITYPLLVIALLIRIIFPIVFAQNYFSDTLYSSRDLSRRKTRMAHLVIRRCCRSSGRRRDRCGSSVRSGRNCAASMRWGLGDVKMMLGVGALIGWRLAFLSIFLGAFSGAAHRNSLDSETERQGSFKLRSRFGIFLGTGSILAASLRRSVDRVVYRNRSCSINDSFSPPVSRQFDEQ
jgi:prepilin signal peptidase PulO-like enzyme (type II secretory pathway)